MTLPPVEERRPDRYYGVTARGLVVIGPRRYRSGETIPCIGVKYAATQGRRVEIPPEEVERVGHDATAPHRVDRRAQQRGRETKPSPVVAAPDPRAPHLVWVHDLETGIGGAERSNAELIRVGLDLGWRITHIHRGNVDQIPRAADAYLVASTAAMSLQQIDRVDEAAYGSGAPIIAREHDYGFCRRRGAIPCMGTGEGCVSQCLADEWRERLDRYCRRLERADLVVWISEAQRDLHERALGRVWRAEHLLPPPVDPDLMRPVDGVARESRLAVCTAGKLNESKGRSNVRAWAAAHPDWRLELYVRGGEAEDRKHGGEWPANVTVLEAVDHDELRRVYSRASLCLFLPSVPEPAGRTPVEAALCGAPVEANEHWSAACFGLPLDDPEGVRERVRAARFDLWRAVEGVVHG